MNRPALGSHAARRPRSAQQPAPVPRASAGRHARWPALLRWSLILLILVLAGRVHEVVPGMARLPLANVAVALVVLALLTRGYLKRLPLVLRAPPVRWALGFLLVGAISVPFAIWPGGAFSALTTSGKLWVLCLILPLAIVTPSQLRVIGQTFAVAATVLVAGYVLEALLGITTLLDDSALGFDRNDVSLYAAMAIPFALSWGGPRGRGRWVGYLIAGTLILGIIATGSRGGFLAMAAVGLVFIVRSRLLSTSRKLLVLAGAVAVALAAGSGEYWDRLAEIFSDPTEDYNFQSREGRIEIWKRGIGYTAANPVTGVGFGNFPIAEGNALEDVGYGVKWSTAHSSYVLVVAELGLPGIIVFLGLLFTIYREAARAARLRPDPRAPPAWNAAASQISMLGDATRLAFLGYVVAAVFLSAAYSVAVLFLTGVAASLYLLRRQTPARRGIGLESRSRRG